MSYSVRITHTHNGWWRSLVAHLTGGQGVAGSNPVHPTRNCRSEAMFSGLFLSCTKEGPVLHQACTKFGPTLAPKRESASGSWFSGMHKVVAQKPLQHAVGQAGLARSAVKTRHASQDREPRIIGKHGSGPYGVLDSQFLMRDGSVTPWARIVTQWSGLRHSCARIA